MPFRPNHNINQSSSWVPAVCVHNGKLHMVFVADNPGYDLLHAESVDGVHWTRRNNVGERGKSSPSLTSFNGHLFLAFVAANLSNDLLYTHFSVASCS